MHAFISFPAFLAVAGALLYGSNARPAPLNIDSNLSSPMVTSASFANIAKRGQVFDSMCVGIQLINGIQRAIYWNNNPAAKPSVADGLNTPSLFNSYDEIENQGWKVQSHPGCASLRGVDTIATVLTSLGAPAVDEDSWIWWQATVSKVESYCIQYLSLTSED